MQPQPGQIGLDRRDVLLAAALQIGIVNPQQEPPASLLGEQPVVQRRADIANVERAGGRGGETGGDSHAAPLASVAASVTHSGTRG